MPKLRLTQSLRARRGLITPVFDPATLSPVLRARAGSTSVLFQDSALTTAATVLGDPIGGWKDDSGNGNNLLQATSGQRVRRGTGSNGLPCVQWNSYNSSVGLALPAGFSTNKQSFTIVFLGEVTGSDLAWQFDFGASSNCMASMGYSTLGTRTALYTGSVVSSTNTAPVAYGPNMWGVLSSGSTGKVFNQNTLTTMPSNYAAGTVTGGNIGKFSGGNPNFRANLFEVLIFSSALAQGDLDNILSYARAVYSVPNVTIDKQVATVGDSLTSSAVSVTNNKGWVTLLRDNLPATTRITNWAVQGSQSNATLSPDTVYNGSLTKNVCVIWSGTNDIASSVATATVLSRLAAVVTARRATGWKVVTGTILPRNGSANANFETDRQTVNTDIRANAGGIYGDAIADIGNDATIGAAGAASNTTYFSDGIHLTYAGNLIAEPLFRTAIGTV